MVHAATATGACCHPVWCMLPLVDCASIQQRRRLVELKVAITASIFPVLVGKFFNFLHQFSGVVDSRERVVLSDVDTRVYASTEGQ